VRHFSILQVVDQVSLPSLHGGEGRGVIDQACRLASQVSRSWALRLRAEVRAEYYSPNPEMWLHWPDFLGFTRRSGEYPTARLAMTHEGRHD
jgi:hypothetical protein